MSNQLMNLYVFAVAYNGKVWGNYTQSQIIEVNLEPRPWVDIYPPAFDGALLPLKLTFNRTEHLATDWSHPRTEGNRTYTHVLPAITEPQGSAYTAAFSNPYQLPYVSYNVAGNNVTIDKTLITPEHEGTHKVKFTLTDDKKNYRDYWLEIKIVFLRTAAFGASSTEEAAEAEARRN